jgi:hypothetical protein
VTDNPIVPEKQTLERIAKQYRKEGYEVSLSPSSADLPEPLRDFQIDLLARKGEETVVVEIKMARTEKPSPEIERLAEAVSRIPNYRFDFVAVQRQPIIGREQWLDSVSLSVRLQESDRLFAQGYVDASILLLWSVTEGILRLLADRHRLGLSSRGPQTMVKTLYSQGLIDKVDADILEQAGQLRNLSVHGYRIEPVGDAIFARWQEVNRRLLAEL